MFYALFFTLRPDMLSNFCPIPKAIHFDPLHYEIIYSGQKKNIKTTGNCKEVCNPL